MADKIKKRPRSIPAAVTQRRLAAPSPLPARGRLKRRSPPPQRQSLSRSGPLGFVPKICKSKDIFGEFQNNDFSVMNIKLIPRFAQGARSDPRLSTAASRYARIFAAQPVSLTKSTVGVEESDRIPRRPRHLPASVARGAATCARYPAFPYRTQGETCARSSHLPDPCRQRQIGLSTTQSCCAGLAGGPLPQ